MKMDKQTIPTLFKVAVALFLAFIYFSLVSGSTIFSVEKFNNYGQETGEDTLLKQSSINVAQSIFGIKEDNLHFLLQASKPYTEEEDTMVFRAIIQNPYKEQVEISYVELFRNGEKVDREVVRYILGVEETYLFKTKPLPIEGKETQRNLFRLSVVLVGANGMESTINYDYIYYLLNSCTTNSECTGLTNVCDRENIARYSTTGESYCVRTCENNGQCFQGQLCLRGRCGY